MHTLTGLQKSHVANSECATLTSVKYKLKGGYYLPFAATWPVYRPYRMALIFRGSLISRISPILNHSQNLFQRKF